MKPPQGILNQKTHRHVECVVITPPKVGPLYSISARAGMPGYLVPLQNSRHSKRNTNDCTHQGDLIKWGDLREDSESERI